MKSNIKLFTVALALLLTATNLLAQGDPSNSIPFTYQGQIAAQSGSPAVLNTAAFALYGDPSNSIPLAGPVTNTISVNSNGLFTTLLNFGSFPFTNPPYYLEITLATNLAGPFTTLTPRQLLTPTPNASYALNAGSAASFGGVVGGDVSGPLNALTVNMVGGVSASNIARGVNLANSATISNLANTIVVRDPSNSIAAGSATLTGALNLPYPAIVTSAGAPFLSDANSIYLGIAGTNVTTPLPLFNAAFGDYALAYEATSTNASGAYNTAVGEFGLMNNICGSENVAVGTAALYGNTLGSDNIASGFQALANNTTGSNNTAIGPYALLANTNGGFNIAIGTQALFANTGGSRNTAVGHQALADNISGSESTAIGFQALLGNTNGGDNTAIGFAALWNNTSGSFNMASGVGALLQSTTGSNNTAVGFQALANANDNDNIALGYMAGFNLTNGDGNIYIGSPGGISESDTIRIGNGQAQTFIAGVINGNGAGLSNLNVGSFSAPLQGSNIAPSSIANTQLVYSSITFIPGPGLSGGSTVFLGSSITLSNSGVTSLASGGGVMVSATNGAVTLSTTATSSNTPMAIVSRDASGSFAATSLNLSSNLSLPKVAVVYAGTNAFIIERGSLYIGYEGGYTEGYGADTQSNVAVGDFSLYTIAQDENSEALGQGSYPGLGSNNVAMGEEALYNDTYGSGNTALGFLALFNNNTGSTNIAVGVGAGINVTGSYNIDIGHPGNASDNGVIRIGGSQQTSAYVGGIYGTALGNGSLVGITSSGQLGTINSIPIADLSADSITINGTPVQLGQSITVGGSGVTSVQVTPNEGLAVASPNGPTVTLSTSPINVNYAANSGLGGDSSFILGGTLHLTSTATSANNASTIVSRDATGSFAAQNATLAGTLNLPSPTTVTAGGTGFILDQSSSIYMGLQNSGYVIGANLHNTAFGDYALGNEATHNTTGSDNSAFGQYALQNNAVGSFNTAAGLQALQQNTSGSNNTASGYQALVGNTTGSGNSAEGEAALTSNSNGNYNTASGSDALYANTSGSYNTADGFNALGNSASGSYNTASGSYALNQNSTGSNNTAVGYSALGSTHTTFNNSALGYEALYNLTTGNSNIAIGYLAGSALTSGSSNIYIGNVGAASENGTIRIGQQGTNTQTFIAGIYGTFVSGSAVQVNAQGQLGWVPSSQRFKDDIRSMDDASDSLLALRPVTFRYKPGVDPTHTPQYGLVAEEVDRVAPDLVMHDEHGQALTVRYEAVNAMLLNEFLKEHRRVEEQSAQLDQLKEKDAALQQRLERLERLVQGAR